jgi:AcrR family transcriptional regulator
MIELLWNPPAPSGRGPRQRLTLDEVVTAATELARQGGGAELSMRGVAAQLGVGAMSLYTYVPGRDELFELMIDRAWSGRKLPDRGLGWRAQVEFHAHEAWRMYQDEPWLIHSNLWRMPLGPHVLDAQEDLYRAVVFGAARAIVTDTGVASRTGLTQDEYWESRAGFWGTYFSSERFPTMTTLWEAGGFDDAVDTSWEFGLALILDGVERLMAAS